MLSHPFENTSYLHYIRLQPCVYLDFEKEKSKTIKYHYYLKELACKAAFVPARRPVTRADVIL